MSGRLRIGTSGYQYRHWQGRFYPRHLPRKEWLNYYAEHFDTVEINNTFYRLPDEATFRQWRGAAPPGFVYALKFSRYGSHIKRLKDGAQTIEAFRSASQPLAEHRGPVLVQLPPRWHADPRRLDDFLSAAGKGQRWAVEFRDPDWLNDEVFQTLQDHGAALCIHDLLPGHPWLATSDWIYLRFHGGRDGHGYTPQYLSAQARRIVAHLAAGRDVYAYFNNDRDANAVRDASALQRYLSKDSAAARYPTSTSMIRAVSGGPTRCPRRTRTYDAGSGHRHQSDTVRSRRRRKSSSAVALAASTSNRL